MRLASLGLSLPPGRWRYEWRAANLLESADFYVGMGGERNGFTATRDLTDDIFPAQRRGLGDGGQLSECVRASHAAGAVDREAAVGMSEVRDGDSLVRQYPGGELGVAGGAVPELQGADSLAVSAGGID